VDAPQLTDPFALLLIDNPAAGNGDAGIIELSLRFTDARAVGLANGEKNA